MARRKLSAIPWGDTAPAVEPYNGIFFPIVEIDDQTGTIYVGGVAAISGPAQDSVQSFSSNIIINFAGAINTFITGVGGGGPGITFTMPSPAGSDGIGPYLGRVIKIKKIDVGVGPVTVVGLIDSDTQYILSNQAQYVILESDGEVWEVVGGN